MDLSSCPVCDTVRPPRAPSCPQCGTALTGAAAEEYAAVAKSLAALDHERATLLARRETALTALRATTRATDKHLTPPDPPTPEPATLETPTPKPATIGQETAGSATVGSAASEPAVIGQATAGRASGGPVDRAWETGKGPAAERAGASGVARDVAGGGESGGPGGRRWDLSHRAVQNVLLGLGGVLLSIAAIVFTLVSWDVPALRALILCVFTLGVLAVPWLLVRRRLAATAETVAYLGLVLLPLDGVAIAQALSGPPSGAGTAAPHPFWIVALAAAALAVLWSAYAWMSPLRLPAPTAIVLANLALGAMALAVLDLSVEGLPWAAAVAVLACAADYALWRVARERLAVLEYAVCATVAALAGTAALALGILMAATAGPAVAPAAAATLAAMTALFAAWALSARGAAWRFPVAAASGLAAMAAVATVPLSLLTAENLTALAGLLTPETPPYPENTQAGPWGPSGPSGMAGPWGPSGFWGVGGSWQVAVWAAAACVVLAVVRRLPAGLRPGVRAGVLIVLPPAAVFAGPSLLTVATVPFARLSAPWPTTSLDVPAGQVWQVSAGDAVTLGLLALAVSLAAVGGPRWRRTGVWMLGTGAAVVLPVGAGLPYPMTLLVVAGTAALALWTGARRAGPAVWVGGYLAALAVCWSLADREATVLVAAGLGAVLAVGALRARTAPAQALTGAGATLMAGVLALALFPGPGATTGGAWAAGALLAVRALTLVVTRPSRKLARAVVNAPATGRTLLLGLLDRLTHAVRPGGRGAVEAAAVALSAFAIVVSGPGRALVIAVAAVLAACSAWRRPRGRWRDAAVAEAGVLAVLAPFALSGTAGPALFGPLTWIRHAWPDAAGSPGATLPWALPDHPDGALLAVLILSATAGTLAAGARWGRAAAVGVASLAYPVALTALPLAAGLPYWVSLAFLLGVTGTLALWSAVAATDLPGLGGAAGTAGAAGLWTGTLAVSWSLADRTATLAVLGAITAIGLLCALRGRGSPVTSAASAVTGLAIGAEGVAAALSAGVTGENAALLLLMIAVLLVRAAMLTPGAVAVPLGATAGVLWTVALGMAGDVPRLTIVLAVGALAMAAASGRRTRKQRKALAMGAILAGAAALLPHLHVWAAAVAFPYGWLVRPWTGAPEEVLTPGDPGGTGTALAAGVLVTVAYVITARRLGGGRAGLAMATVAVPLCLQPVPLMAELPYAGVPAFLGCLVVALAVQAGRDRLAGGIALVLGAHLVVWSLAAAPYTLGVLAGLTLLAGALAVRAPDLRVRRGAAATATVAGGGLALAAALAAGLTGERAAFALIAVAALAATAAARLHPRPVAVAVELPGWGLAVAGVLLTASEPATACLALAATGVLVLVVSLRPERRDARWAGLSLLQLALWLKLALEGVTAPEAYTVPLSVAGLIAAWLVRRRDPTVSSWIGYGSALALTFLPSLVAAWNDPALLRPLLLGTAAFAATLAGARARLQAPLLLGGAVLVVTAAHEFAPAIGELVGQGPRWLPIALAGAFLLFTGATYEHRLRDLRRVRGLLVRMR
ncbi:SCO7613 C-terminal domain-containing membrane protein [Nonomuraea sp. NPDC050394]|uniref:SCO7613 C-terminal domain-containing membrane protein n=1 Tax=Nonomuraea sp. NPDC050394 TaxID=3364363 RepID=UPI003797966E